MSRKQLKLFAMLLTTLVLSLLLACASPTATSQVPTSTAVATSTASPTGSATATATATATLTPKYGGVLKVVARNYGNVFGYPGDMGLSYACDLSTPGLEPICGVDLKGEFTPTKLSTAFEVAPDGKSITFTLRQGVKFHDGTDFNAAAAKWSLELLKQARAVGTEAIESNPSVDVIDDYTIRIKLKQYTNTFIGQLGSVSRIASPTAFEKNGKAWVQTHPVGTGPFKFVSFTPDTKVIWERNDDYWGGKPYLDGLEVYLMKDEMAKSAAIQSKAVDVLFNCISETGVGLRDKGLIVNAGGQQSMISLVPDSKNADSPLSNKKVREAIEYAIDKNGLTNLGNGFWIPIWQCSTPETPGFVPDYTGRQYDLEKAKQLMAEAGYTSGFNLDFIYSSSTFVTPTDAVTAIAQFLSKINITSNLRPMPSNQRTEISKAGWDSGFVTAGIYCSLDYLSGLTYNISPTGPLLVSCARPDGFGTLLEDAKAEMDIQKAAEMAQQIDMMLYDDLTIIPLWAQPSQIYAEQPYVHDAGLYSTGSQYDWTPQKAWLSN